MTGKLVEHLQQFVTERRARQFDIKLKSRTRYLTVVLEDIYQPHNASAVLRSCECFGIQDVHIIENKNPFRVSPDIALGSQKWLTIQRYNTHPHNTSQALESLKKRGFRIVAASPHRKDQLIEEFDLEAGKTALIFGSELEGLSHTAHEIADEFIRVPMVGFTESLNISVSAAICIHFLASVLRKSDLPWQLSREEQLEVKLYWLKNSIKNSEMIERAFLEDERNREDQSVRNSRLPPG